MRFNGVFDSVCFLLATAVTVGYYSLVLLHHTTQWDPAWMEYLPRADTGSAPAHPRGQCTSCDPLLEMLL